MIITIVTVVIVAVLCPCSTCMTSQACRSTVMKQQRFVLLTWVHVNTEPRASTWLIGDSSHSVEWLYTKVSPERETSAIFASFELRAVTGVICEEGGVWRVNKK